MARVIHTAQALVDLVVQIPALPRRGDNVNAEAATRYAGGAVNILAAAARTGAPAVHAGAHGTGPNGDLVREALAAEGVDLSAPAVPEQDTGVCVVMLEPNGERTFVTTYGAERVISAESLATSAPGEGDYVCVSGYSLFRPTRAPLLEWLETLDRRQVRIVLDPGAAFAAFSAHTRDRMLQLTDVWTSNAEEARGLTGLMDLEAALEAIVSILAEDAVVIVRDGARGCWVAQHGTTTHVPGFPQEAVDTNGAGDAHTGVLLAERVRGADWVEAARRANAAAAIKVTRHGPVTSPRRDEVDALLAHW